MSSTPAGLPASTRQAALRFAKESLGMQSPEVRTATAAEKKRIGNLGYRRLEHNDAPVVLREAGDAFEVLALVDHDVEGSRHRKQHSAQMTTLGMVPVVGKLAVVTHALKDLGTGLLHARQSMLRREAVAPEDSALMHTAVKHLGLCGASFMTAGLAHLVVLAAEVAVAGDDFGQGDPSGHPAKGAWASVRGLVASHDTHGEAEIGGHVVALKPVGID